MVWARAGRGVGWRGDPAGSRRVFEVVSGITVDGSVPASGVRRGLRWQPFEPHQLRWDCDPAGEIADGFGGGRLVAQRAAEAAAGDPNHRVREPLIRGIVLAEGRSDSREMGTEDARTFELA